jgi:exodeoxyribonuclease VII large subunit
MVKKENIFTVSEVTKHIKNVIESNIPNLYVEGEISNFTKHRSGHIYFSIKDSKSTLKCVFFKSYNTFLQFLPKVGDQVICLGKITVFEKSGNYQLNVTRMYPTGINNWSGYF